MTNEYERAAERIVDTLGEPAARDLLRLLDADDQAAPMPSDSSTSGAGMSRCSTH
jgi:hypothetical protein